MNPKTLKRARCRVLARLAGLDDASHECGQLAGCSNRVPTFAARNKRTRNRPSKPFFAMVADHLCDVALVSAGQKVRGGLTAGRVHAHVQRRIEAKAEAALAVVDLWRAHPQVEQHAVDARDAARGQLGRHLAEAGVHDGKSRVGGQRVITRAGGGHGLGVAVERDQPAVGVEQPQHRARMPAAAKGAVHIGAAGPRHQGLDGLGEQHRLVRAGGWGGQGRHRMTKLRSFSGRSPASMAASRAS